MKLFDKIENEKVHGLNEEVLKTLVKFYANAPEERSAINLKPYLGESVKTIADIEHDERRNWLEKQYKYLMCNRTRHRCVAMHEIMLNIILIFVHYLYIVNLNTVYGKKNIYVYRYQHYIFFQANAANL